MSRLRSSLFAVLLVAGKTRVWNPKQQRWRETGFPTSLVGVEASGHHYDAGVRFGVVTPDGKAAMLVRNETTAGAWIFDGQQWVEKPSLLNGLVLKGQPIYTSLSRIHGTARQNPQLVV